MAAVYDLKRGSSLVLGLEVTAGASTTEDAVVTASIKAADTSNNASNPPGDAAAVLGNFTVEAVDNVDPADLSSGPGWILSLDASVSESLPVGIYIADARIVLVGGDVHHTDNVIINVVERVTET